MQIDWDAGDASGWRAFHAQARAAMQQHHGFGDAMRSLGTDVRRAHLKDDQGQTLGIAQFIVRRLGGLASLALCSRGPVWRENLEPERRREGYRMLATSLPAVRPRIVLFAPPLAGIGTGEKGLIRVVTGEAIALLDLRQGPAALRAAMHPKWRNRLVAAERGDLTVHRVGNKPAQYRWLLEREGLQRERRDYRALPSAFIPAWQEALRGDAHSMLILRADLGREPVAAMLFTVHGRAATYHLGWSSEVGREHSAHNLLLWRAINELPAMDVDCLELGAVNTQRGAALARFKIGTGATVVHYGGTFW